MNLNRIVKKVKKFLQIHGEIIYAVLFFELIGIWLLLMGFIKYLLYIKSRIFSDINIYSNMFWNTDFLNHILYTDYGFQRFGAKTFFAVHFIPSWLLIYVPLYKLISSPAMLLVIHTIIAPALTVWILLLLGKELKLKFFQSSMVVLAYLFSPAIILASIDDFYGFHPDCLIPPFVALTFLFYFRKNLKIYVMLVLITLGLKTNIPFMFFIFGFLLLLFKDSRKYGVYTLGISICFIILNLLVPKIIGLEKTATMNLLPGLIKLILNGDWKFFYDRLYIYSLHSQADYNPLMLPALFSPVVFLPVLSELILYTYWGAPNQWYIFSFMIFICIAALKSYSVLNKHRYLSVVGMLVVAYFGINTVIHSYTFWKKHVSRAQALKFQINRDELKEIRPRIPKDAILSATSDLHIYFTNRLHLSDVGKTNADYVLINTNMEYMPPYDEKLISDIISLEKEKKYSVFFKSRDGLILYKRKD